MNFRLLLAALSVLAWAGCQSPSSQAPQPYRSAAPYSDPVFATEGAFDDDPHPLSPTEASVIAAGRDPAKLQALEQRFVVALLQPEALPEATEETARSLGLVLQIGPNGPSAATLAALAVLLEDPARVDYARLALDRIPGSTVDQVYLNALPAARGRVRLALINSLGARGVVRAIPVLAPAMDDPDPEIARAAAGAVGRIGGFEALSALERSQRPLAPEILNARLAAASESGPDVLARTAAEIQGNASAPLAQRAAALRLLIAAEPSQATAVIDASLRGDETAFQRVALEAVGTLTKTPGAAAALVDSLPDYAPPVRAALVAGLATLGDAAAVPALLATATDAGDEARVAAITALGQLPGSVDVARTLAGIAAQDGPAAKAASASLARLQGPGIDDFLRGLVGHEATPLRLVGVQQIAARNQTLAIPLLLQLRKHPDEALRLEALESLRIIASGVDEPALIDWALDAPSKAEQNRAVRALITVVLRSDDGARRLDLVSRALETGSTADRLVLLPVLSRVPGATSLATARKLALGTVGAETQAAVAELARWPDQTAVPVLGEVAQQTSDEGTRASAVRAVAGFLSRQTSVPSPANAALIRSLLQLPVGVPEKLSLLDALSYCADRPSLDAAEKFVADPDLGAHAREAIDAIQSNFEGPPAFTASGGRTDLRNLTDGRPATLWSVPNTPDQWLLADLHRSRPVRRVLLDEANRGWEYPAQLEVYVSDDSAQPGEARATVEGQRGKTLVTLPAGVRGRYVWLKQTGKREAPWTVAELLIQ